jgi:hypothetical protein
MKRKLYIMPRTKVVKLEVQRLLASSQFDVPVNDPSNEIDAEEALSREDELSWDEYEE